jgi:LytS/YehU family sensor histidine kinase
VDAVFTKICILVTAAFALTVLPWGFKHSKGSLLVARNRGSALVVFLVLGLVEEASGWRNPWLNERIVTVCAAGLVAGPLVGLVVSVFVTRLAGEWLEMSVNDDGPGASSSEVEQVFFAAGPRVHALPLLRRRLEKLFGRSFRLEVRTELVQGTQVTMRIPLLKCGEPAAQKWPLAKPAGRTSGAPAPNVPRPGSYGS